MTSWERLVQAAQTRHCTISTRSANHLDISSSQLAAWCQQGRLLHPAPEVYVLTGSQSTWRQRVSIAVASGNGIASHRTAAVLWKFKDFEPRQIEILAHHGRGRSRSNWIVHETRQLHGVDLDEVDGIPCRSVARTVLDLAAVEHPFKVGEALDHACRQWPGMLNTITQRFVELAGRGRPGTRLMREMLEERHGNGQFAETGFERKALELVRSIGLPEPTLHHHIRDGDFSAYPDLAWLPIRWAIECDSLAWHSGKSSHEWDRYRRRRLKMLGWDLAEVTYDDVTKNKLETGRHLRTLYAARREAVLAGLKSNI